MNKARFFRHIEKLNKILEYDEFVASQQQQQSDEQQSTTTNSSTQTSKASAPVDISLSENYLVMIQEHDDKLHNKAMSSNKVRLSLSQCNT